MLKLNIFTGQRRHQTRKTPRKGATKERRPRIPTKSPPAALLPLRLHAARLPLQHGTQLQFCTPHRRQSQGGAGKRRPEPDGARRQTAGPDTQPNPSPKPAKSQTGTQPERKTPTERKPPNPQGEHRNKEPDESVYVFEAAATATSLFESGRGRPEVLRLLGSEAKRAVGA